MKASRFYFLLLVLSLFASAQVATDAKLCADLVAKVALQHPASEYLSYQPDASAMSVAQFQQKPTFNVLSFNVENLFLLQGKYVPDTSIHTPDPVMGFRKQVENERPKDPKETQAVADVITENKTDFLVAEEVEGDKSDDKFATQNLKGKYQSLTIIGNDGRGIDISPFVSKELPVEVLVESHKDEPYQNPLYPHLTRVFSRDFPVMLLRIPKSQKPFLIVAGVHSKSKRSETAQDPESNQIRAAQADRMAQILSEYRTRFPGTPMLVMGDFNDDVTSKTYDPIKKLGFKDAFDVAQKGTLPEGDLGRVTHTYHPKNEPPHLAQMDAIFVSPEGQGLVKTVSVYRYKDAAGKEKPIPRTYEERKENPSDHFPVKVELDLPALLKQPGVLPVSN